MLLQQPPTLDFKEPEAVDYFLTTTQRAIARYIERPISLEKIREIRLEMNRSPEFADHIARHSQYNQPSLILKARTTLLGAMRNKIPNFVRLYSDKIGGTIYLTGWYDATISLRTRYLPTFLTSRVMGEEFHFAFDPFLRKVKVFS